MQLRAFGHFRPSTPAWWAVPASDSPPCPYAAPLSRMAERTCSRALVVWTWVALRLCALILSLILILTWLAWSQSMAVTLMLLFFVSVSTVWAASFALHSARPSTALAVLEARERVGTSSNPHSALITPPPQVQDQALFERDAVATCGYVSGNAGL